MHAARPSLSSDSFELFMSSTARLYLDSSRPALEREVSRAINIAITERAEDIVLRVGELMAASAKGRRILILF